jgi:hypothetical protein
MYVQFRLAGDVDLTLAERERSQSMRIFIRFGGETLRLPARTEGIGELGHRENALGMLLLAFLGGHARQQA